MEEFATYLNNLGIAYLVSCAVCLVWNVGVLVGNWWIGENITGHVIVNLILLALIPVLNISAMGNGIAILLSSKLEKFSIKGRKK